MYSHPNYYGTQLLMLLDMQNVPRVFPTPLGPLTRLLLRMGLTDSSSPSKAVLNSLLAISALHLFGDARAAIYKIRATSLINASLSGATNSPEVVMKIITASMLLYLYEVSLAQALILARHRSNAARHFTCLHPRPGRCIFVGSNRSFGLSAVEKHLLRAGMSSLIGFSTTKPSPSLV